MPAAQAGALYFLIVFAGGFFLGTVRVAFIQPALGAVAAVALEMPLMLSIAWSTARIIISRLAIARSPMPRLVMGGLALALLLIAEFIGFASLMGTSGAEYLAELTTHAGLIGLTGQVIFAIVPLAQLRCRNG